VDLDRLVLCDITDETARDPAERPEQLSDHPTAEGPGVRGLQAERATGIEPA
jgi:hypothetical protein